MICPRPSSGGYKVESQRTRANRQPVLCVSTSDLSGARCALRMSIGRIGRIRGLRTSVSLFFFFPFFLRRQRLRCFASIFQSMKIDSTRARRVQERKREATAPESAFSREIPRSARDLDERQKRSDDHRCYDHQFMIAGAQGDKSKTTVCTYSLGLALLYLAARLLMKSL